MVTLELSMDEADMLASILKSDLSDLRMEMMKKREAFINLMIGTSDAGSRLA
jgi:hypothetical protein